MSELGDRTRKAEELTDAHARAVNAAAEAEAAYLRVKFTAIATCDQSLSEAAKERLGEAAALEERIAWVRAKASVRIASKAVETALKGLSAAQSHYKFQREQS